MLDVAFPNSDKAIDVSIGKRPQQDTFEDAEDRRVGADAERKSERRHDREAGRAADRAKGVAQIVGEPVDPVDAPDGAALLSDTRDVAEASPPVGSIIALEHSLMEAQLLGQLGVETVAAQQIAGAAPEHPHTARMTRAITANICSKVDSATPSRVRPAAVRV